MKPFAAAWIAFTIIGLSACGADSMSAAATAAALKKQEIEQGKKTMNQFEQRLKTATDQMQESARRAGDQVDSN